MYFVYPGLCAAHKTTAERIVALWQIGSQTLSRYKMLPILQEQEKTFFDEVENLLDEVDVLEKVLILFQHTSQYAREQGKIQIENLTTRSLRYIFDKDYKFEIDIKFVEPEKYTGKKYNEESLLKLLGLISNQSETLVALDATNNIMVYDNIGQILYEYIVYF